MSRRVAPALLATLLLSACGSTVAERAGSQGAPVSQGGLGQDGAEAGGGVGRTGGTPVESTGTQIGRAPSAVAGGTGSAPGTNRTGSVALPTSGTAKVLSPITIAMVKTATTGAASIGLKLNNTYTEQQFYDALIGALNARGGLAGRKIKPVYDEVDPFHNNWAQDYAEACSKFTQDHKVDLVLGYVFNYDRAFEACLARKGIPHLSTTFNVPDETELRKFPLLLNVEVPTITRRTLAKLDGATATGALTPASKVGVAYDNCPGTQRSYTQAAKPAFARYKVKVVKEFQLSCVTGQSDSGRSTAEIQSMGLQFQSAGVTHVFLHSVSEGPAMAFFMQNAESQNYHPTYIMSSLANLMFATTNPQLVPPEQARNVKAFGWMPFEDVTVDKYPAKNAAQLRCLDLLKSQKVVPTSSLDYKFAYTTCEVLFIAERALTATRGDSTGPTFIRGVQSLGTSFQSVSKLGGFAAFGTNRHDAVLKARPLIYFDSCSCFNYTGSVRDIPAS